MLLIVMAIGVLMALIGLFGIVVPNGLHKFGKWFLDGPGVWGGVAFRVIAAVALWFGANASLTPLPFKFFAVASLMGALALPFMGHEGLKRIVDRSATMSPTTLRLYSLMATLAGVFFFWSARGV